jgi:hypothetical protein
MACSSVKLFYIAISIEYASKVEGKFCPVTCHDGDTWSLR